MANFSRYTRTLASLRSMGRKILAGAEEFGLDAAAKGYPKMMAGRVKANEALAYIKGIQLSPTTKDAWDLTKSIAKNAVFMGDGNRISRGLYMAGGGIAGAGYSAYSDDGHMGRDTALGVLGGAMGGVSRDLWKNKSKITAIGSGFKSELTSVWGKVRDKGTSKMMSIAESISASANKGRSAEARARVADKTMDLMNMMMG